MASKTKGKKKKDNQPKEEMPRIQVTESEAEAKETVEEKSPAAVDRFSGSTKTKDELWDECVRLQDDLARAQKQKARFKIEKDSAQRSWGNSKRNLEEAKTRMREKLRLKQEAEKRRQAEIEKYQQKLIQLEIAHHSEICELKMAAAAATSKIQKELVESVAKLQEDIDVLHSERREKEFHREIYINKLKQKQQNELRELNESYNKQTREIGAQYQNQIQIMFVENRKQTDTELDEVNIRMRKCVKRIKEEHKEAMINLHTANRSDVMNQSQRLVKENEALKNTNKRLDRRTTTAAQRNKELRESLQEGEQKLSESRQRLTAGRKAMAKRLKKSHKVSAHLREKTRELVLKQAQLEQSYSELQQEYEELQKTQTQAVLDEQQRSSLKEMVLERKITAVTATLEKEQLKLWVALAFAQGDQTAAKKTRELFESKHTTIKALKDDISLDLMEYDHLVRKATALNVPVDKCNVRQDVVKSLRKASEESEKVNDLMQELKAFCISEYNSVQRDTQGLHPPETEP